MVNLRVGSRDALRFESRWKEGEAGTPPRIVLDGLLISGRPVVVNGRFTCVTIRHCTLVPGWSIDEHCEPTDAEESSLELINTEAEALIERSIVGTIIVRQDEVKTDPLPLTIEDSIVDSTGPKEAALCGRGGRYAFTHLTMRRTTVFGPVLVHAVALAENSIFMDPMRVVRSQIGCMRFCYVPEGSRTPRRYHCQPDEALSAVDASPCLAGEAYAGERKVRKAVELRRVRPQISCNRYGYPDYARLALTCAEEIAQGADDRSEMGAYHDLYNPQRLANLRRRLDEYTPAGMESGVIFET
jgi:hypothetical protein